MNKFRNPLFVIFITVFIDLVGFGILIPVIPLLLGDPTSKFYLSTPGANPQEQFKNGLIILGFLTAAFPLAQFFATPILGQLSDKYGRKKLLFISLAGTCISYMIFALGIITKNIPLLFASRIFDGITGGNIAVAQAAIADITTPENRAKNFGLIGAAFGLGFVLGPYIGGKLSDSNVVSWFDATTPFWFAAILSALNLVSIYFFFPETLKNKMNDKKIEWTKSVHNIIKAARSHNAPAFLTNFIFNAGFTFFTTFASVYFFNKFHMNQGNVGDLFAYVGIWIAISQAVVTPILAKRLKEFQVLKFSLFMTALGILLIFLSNEVWQLLLIMPILSIGNGLTFANIAGLISRTADDDIQGEVLGINFSVQALGQAIPPILSGYIAASLAPESPLLVGAIVGVLAGIVFNIFYFKYKLPEKKDKDTSNEMALG